MSSTVTPYSGSGTARPAPVVGAMADDVGAGVGDATGVAAGDGDGEGVGVGEGAGVALSVPLVAGDGEVATGVDAAELSEPPPQAPSAEAAAAAISARTTASREPTPLAEAPAVLADRRGMKAGTAGRVDAGLVCMGASVGSTPLRR